MTPARSLQAPSIKLRLAALCTTRTFDFKTPTNTEFTHWTPQKLFHSLSIRLRETRPELLCTELKTLEDLPHQTQSSYLRSAFHTMPVDYSKWVRKFPIRTLAQKHAHTNARMPSNSVTTQTSKSTQTSTRNPSSGPSKHRSIKSGPAADTKSRHSNMSASSMTGYSSASIACLRR